jgi:hypothetical protein
MTDFSSRDLDALASDLVDGLLPPAEAARARQDPEVAARVASLEALRAAIRSVPPPDPGMSDRIIAAAIASASTSPAQELPPTRQLTAVPLPPPPYLSSAPAPPPPPARSVRSSARVWLAAAAAIVVAGLVTAGLVSQSGHDGQNESVAAPSSAKDEANDKSVGAAGPESTPAPTPPGSTGGKSDSGGNGDTPSDQASSSSSTSSPASILVEGSDDLGDVGSADELAALVRQQGASESPGTTRKGDGDGTMSANGDESEECPGLTEEGDPARGTSTYFAHATYDGTPVVVHLYEQAGERRLVATDDSCVDIVDVPYNG